MKLSRKAKRHLLIPLFSALLGAAVVLAIEWTLFRPRQIQLPVLVASNNMAPVVSNLAPNEFQARIKINPCIDLRSFVCAGPAASDPTGKVRRESEGEVEVLRIYESIVRSSRAGKKLSEKQIEEKLVERIYSKDRTQKIRTLFKKVQTQMLTFIEGQPETKLKDKEKEILKNKISSVILEMPPPASVYKGETSLFTHNDIYFERTAEGLLRIRVGGALLFTVQSEFNLAFTLAHELAHAIDPCELHAEKNRFPVYEDLIECFGSFVENISNECSSKGKLAEVFADWMATSVVAELLQKAASRYRASELRNAVFNSVRDLCRDEGADLTQSSSGELSSAHPNAAFRVNRIYAQHPKIRKILGCSEANEGNPHCFWNTL